MLSFTHRSSALFVALFLGAAALPKSLEAQQDSSTNRSMATEATTTAPQAAGAVVAPTLLSGPRVAPSGITRPAYGTPFVVGEAQGDNVGVGPNLALMGAGAAAIVVGLLIGGDGGTIVALSGGVLALVGLYRYLR